MMDICAPISLTRAPSSRYPQMPNKSRTMSRWWRRRLRRRKSGAGVRGREWAGRRELAFLCKVGSDFLRSFSCTPGKATRDGCPKITPKEIAGDCSSCNTDHFLICWLTIGLFERFSVSCWNCWYCGIAVDSMTRPRFDTLSLPFLPCPLPQLSHPACPRWAGLSG